MRYDREPSYRPARGRVRTGWDEAVAGLRDGPAVLALDGPAYLDWDGAVGGISKALADRGVAVEVVDLSSAFLPWDELVRLTEEPGDPHFTKLCERPLGDLLRLPARPPRTRPRHPTARPSAPRPARSNPTPRTSRRRAAHHPAAARPHPAR